MIRRHNGTVRYHKGVRKWLTSCEICWDGPKGRTGHGFASEGTTSRRAQAGLSRHIRTQHGVEPVIRIGGVMS